MTIQNSISLFDLTGRTALITGSTRGIGFALAQGLAQSGAKIIVNSRKNDDVTAAVAKLKAMGFDVEGSAFDVADEASVDAAFAGFDARAINIDILINNAGIQHRQPMVDLQLAD